MDASEIRAQWRRDGFVIVPGLVSTEELAPGLAALPDMFPTAEEFHNDVDPQRNARFRDEFGGITDFPFANTDLSLLSVHEKLIDLAEDLLGTASLRVYSIEAWAKYTGAANYDQHHHRDYLNHTVLVPSRTHQAQQVEMFLYLVDIPVEMGPPSYAPWPLTADLPALPNWYPASDGVTDPDSPPGWVSHVGRPDLYRAEVSAAGPAGTVVAYRLETLHRGTEVTAPGGARYTIHVNFRTATADWIGRHSWPALSLTRQWSDFVGRASPRQLQLFGFPPPGHPYWSGETLAGMLIRYPGFDAAAWRDAPPTRCVPLNQGATS